MIVGDIVSVIPRWFFLFCSYYNDGLTLVTLFFSEFNTAGYNYSKIKITKIHTNLPRKHSMSNGNSKWLPKRYIATSFKGGNSYLQIQSSC